MDRDDSIQQFAQYLQRRAPHRRTAIDYVSDVRQLAAFNSKPWREITMHDIDAFVDQQRQIGHSPATVKRRTAALKVFFDFLAEGSDDLNWPNPVRFKRHAGKQPRRLPRDLKDEEIERLWATIQSPRDRAWFALMLRAGLRVGEVVSLQPTDLLAAPSADQPARLRVCGKGQKERVVLLTSDAYAVLQTWLAVRSASDQPFLFLNERSGPLTVNGIEWLLHGYAARAGVEVTPHQLRHTFARQVTEAGMPVTSLGKLLGHADISTTQIYTAGADPELCHAYQSAMAQLASTPLPSAASPVADMLPSGVATQAPLSPPPLPDWDAWATHLPPALRQASLEFVQRRLPTYTPRRRRLKALHDLAELRRFWDWQLAHRPIRQLSELRLADLRAYQTARGAQGKAAATVNDTLRYVLAVLREQAEAGQAIDANVFRLHPLPRPDSLPRHLSEGESQRLEAYVLARLDSPDPLTRLENACCLVLAHTGLRASECVDLHFRDLDLAAGRLTVRQGKGQRDRVVYLSDTAGQALRCYLAGLARQPADPVWTRPAGQPITYEWLYAHIAALGLAAGVPEVTPHRLRHTLATRLLNSGMDITRIQKLLGHQHIDTTMIYARVQDATLETDYRRAMSQIERQQMPLSNVPLLVANWPTQTPATCAEKIFKEPALDNSV